VNAMIITRDKNIDRTGKQDVTNELQEIIGIFSECVNNYNKTQNQKIKLEEYKNALERVTAHQNILLGKELN
jgi:hypothetical protein